MGITIMKTYDLVADFPYSAISQKDTLLTEHNSTIWFKADTINGPDWIDPSLKSAYIWNNE